jgi:hypothetical protein
LKGAANIMNDYLIMLLSTDWFLPFWAEIGIDVDDPTKVGIQGGCRAIVKKFMGGAKEYYDISFSEERRQETDLMFMDMLDRLGARSAVSEAVEGWTSRPKDGLWAATMFRILRDDLLSGDSGSTASSLDTTIRLEVVEASTAYDVDPSQFEKISMESRTSWDEYIRSLFDDQPTALFDNLAPIIAERRLRALWNRICRRLTQTQRQALIFWYREIAQSRGIPGDPVPYYIS